MPSTPQPKRLTTFEQIAQGAQRKAARKGTNAQILPSTMRELSADANHFDAAFTIRCFHPLDECERGHDAAALHRVCREGAVSCLRAFRRKHPGIQRSPTLTQEQIRSAFPTGGCDDLYEPLHEICCIECLYLPSGVFAGYGKLR